MVQNLNGTPDKRSKLSIWLIKRSNGCFPVYSGRIRFGKRNHWLLVAVYVGVCLEVWKGLLQWRLSYLHVRWLPSWLLSVPPVQPCVLSVDF